MSATMIAENIAAWPVETLLEHLRAQGIRTPRPAEVRDYLTRYPDVIASIRNASKVAVQEFAGKAVLSLELYVDPDSTLSILISKSNCQIELCFHHLGNM